VKAFNGNSLNQTTRDLEKDNAAHQATAAQEAALGGVVKAMAKDIKELQDKVREITMTRHYLHGSQKYSGPSWRMEVLRITTIELKSDLEQSERTRKSRLRS
jgi:hypothetical protein